ncbi:MAG: hypothetical protein Q8L84_02080 [Hyphomonas sp.]|nr:hypothetical protein [Hyphomonas sp.]
MGGLFLSCLFPAFIRCTAVQRQVARTCPSIKRVLRRAMCPRADTPEPARIWP